jgi:hypothetical protein
VSGFGLERLLLLALASSGGVHAGLVPSHMAEGTLLGVLFALSAVVLLGVALLLERAPGRAAAIAAALLLGSLLAAYAGARVIALPPLTHAESLDALGAATKLTEAAGLVLALRLAQTPAGGERRLPALREGAGP